MQARSTSVVLLCLLLLAGSLGARGTASSGYGGGLELRQEVALDGHSKLNAATAAAAAAAAELGGLGYSQPVMKKPHQQHGQGMCSQPLQARPPRAARELIFCETLFMVCGSVAVLVISVQCWDAPQSRSPIAHLLRRNARCRSSRTSSSRIIMCRRDGLAEPLQIVQGGGGRPGGTVEQLLREQLGGWLARTFAYALKCFSHSSVLSHGEEEVGAVTDSNCGGPGKEEETSSPVPRRQQAHPPVVRRGRRKSLERRRSGRQQVTQNRSSEVNIGDAGGGRQTHSGSVKQPKGRRRDGQASRRGFLGPISAGLEFEDAGGNGGLSPAHEEQEGSSSRKASEKNNVGSSVSAEPAASLLQERATRPASSPNNGSYNVEHCQVPLVPSAGFQVGMWSKGGIWGPPGRNPPPGPLLPPSANFLASIGGNGSWPWNSPTVTYCMESVATETPHPLSDSPPSDFCWKMLAQDIQNLLACSASEDEEEFWKSVDSSHTCSSVSSGTDTDGGSVPSSPTSKVPSPFNAFETSPMPVSPLRPRSERTGSTPVLKGGKATLQQVGVIGQGLGQVFSTASCLAAVVGSPTTPHWCALTGSSLFATDLFAPQAADFDHGNTSS